MGFFHNKNLRLTFFIFLECPIGSFGEDCEENCPYPQYGDYCQSTCYCSKDGCHYSHGCITDIDTFIYQELSTMLIHNNDIANNLYPSLSCKCYIYIRHKNIKSYIHWNFLIGSPRIFSTKPSTPSLSVSISNTQDFSTDIIHQKADKVDNNSSNDDWLKNGVALSLFGIFVLFFAVFVIVYIYLKCFRKASIAKTSKNAEWQVQYRSLNLDTRQPMRSAYEEPREQLMADSTHLSPVLSRNEGNEISSFQIDYMNIDNNDVSREITGGGHSLSRVPTFTENRTNSFLALEERIYHVYTEIAEISTESSNVADGYDCKSHVSSSIEKSTAIDSEVLYMNVKSEQF